MRKITIGVVVLLLALATFGMVSADGGPHGGYTPTTDACAGCHRAHTAVGPNLLVETSTYALCSSCHGSAATGANTNVDDGFYLSSRGGDTTSTPDNDPLLGGGFLNYGGAAVTSKHDIDPGAVPAPTDLAWGNGVARGVTAAIADGALSCASCHDPHGSANYRIINETINGNAVSVALVDEGAGKNYANEVWGAGTSDFCAACHDAYHRTAAGQGSIIDGGTYTHRIDMPYNYDGNVNPETIGWGSLPTLYLPLAGTDTVVCMTCHLPHGSSSAMAGIADGTGLPGGTSATDSALLRLDNRGVCEVCHQK